MGRKYLSMVPPWKSSAYTRPKRGFHSTLLEQWQWLETSSKTTLLQVRYFGY
nr:hypothetical protein Iba_chr11dCG1680 [Ipomoea batatas]